MPNQTTKRFYATTDWTCPAGVTTVSVSVRKKNIHFDRCGKAPAVRFKYIDRYGNAYAWGDNTNGAIGDGTIAAKSSPTLVVGGLSFLKVDSSLGNMGIASNGSAYTWGPNSSGELGDGTVAAKSSPVAVVGGLKFIDLQLGFGSANSIYGIAVNGLMYSWGDNTFGNLGDNSVTKRSSPVAVVGGLKWKSVMPRIDGGVVGLSLGGAAYGWGRNSDGCLGTNDVTAKSSPTLVVGGLTFSKIDSTPSQASARTAGIAVNGDLYMWGNNDSGHLGDNSVTKRSSPVAVVGGLKWRDVAVTDNSSFGISTTGNLYAWGANTNGQLGLGDTTPRSSPTLVVGGLKWVKVFVNSPTSASFGISVDGNLYAWGLNTNGQLGVNDTTPRSSPTLVVGGLKFSDIAAAGSTAVAVASDGNLYAWGNNANGQVGDGTVVAKSSPVLVINGSIGLDETTVTKIVTVTPGSSYRVGISQIGVVFGTEKIVTGLYDEVTLQY